MFVGDKVLVGSVSPGSATTTAGSLTCGFDTQDDETILTRELVLAQQPDRLLSVLSADQRSGHAQRFGVAGRPRVAIGIRLAFAVRSGSVPNDFLRPDDVVEYVAVVETVDVVLAGRNELAGTAAAVHLVPRAEQHFALE